MMNLNANKPTWGIVLAAGFGKRLKPLTDNMPKPLITVHGITLLDHAIQNLIDVGIVNIVVNGHYKADMIKNHLDAKWNKPGINIHFIYEPEILETGGGIMNIMQQFDIEKVLVSNSDMLLIDETQPALTPLIESSRPAQLVLMVQHYSNSPQGIEYGDFMLAEDDRFIFNSTERGPYFFLGSYIVDRSIFADQNHVHSFSMLHYISKNTAEKYQDNSCFVVRFGGIFLDIGTIAMLNKAEEILNKISYTGKRYE